MLKCKFKGTGLYLIFEINHNRCVLIVIISFKVRHKMAHKEMSHLNKSSEINGVFYSLKANIKDAVIVATVLRVFAKKETALRSPY